MLTLARVILTLINLPKTFLTDKFVKKEKKSFINVFISANKESIFINLVISTVAIHTVAIYRVEAAYTCHTYS